MALAWPPFLHRFPFCRTVEGGGSKVVFSLSLSLSLSRVVNTSQSYLSPYRHAS